MNDRNMKPIQRTNEKILIPENFDWNKPNYEMYATRKHKVFLKEKNQTALPTSRQ